MVRVIFLNCIFFFHVINYFFLLFQKYFFEKSFIHGRNISSVNLLFCGKVVFLV